MVEELSQFNMVIVHGPGRKHTNVDVLSRRPLCILSIHFCLGVPLIELTMQGLLRMSKSL